MKKLFLFLIAIATSGVLFIACESEINDLTTVLEDNVELRSNDCYNFEDDFFGCLDVFPLEINGEVIWGFGALPTLSEVGPYTGYFSSVVIEETPSGNGAVHYKLIHKFEIDEENYFFTDDKAICAPANGQGATCLINDQMTIVGGYGVFANVSGKIKTHGPLTIGDPSCPLNIGSLNLNLKGKVCLNN